MSRQNTSAERYDKPQEVYKNQARLNTILGQIASLSKTDSSADWNFSLSLSSMSADDAASESTVKQASDRTRPPAADEMTGGDYDNILSMSTDESYRSFTNAQLVVQVDRGLRNRGVDPSTVRTAHNLAVVLDRASTTVDIKVVGLAWRAYSETLSHIASGVPVPEAVYDNFVSALSSHKVSGGRILAEGEIRSASQCSALEYDHGMWKASMGQELSSFGQPAFEGDARTTSWRWNDDLKR